MLSMGLEKKLAFPSLPEKPLAKPRSKGGYNSTGIRVKVNTGAIDWMQW